MCGYCVITFQLHPVHLCCGCKVPWRRPAELLYAVLSRKAAAAGWNMRTLIQKQQVRLITMRVIIYAVASRQSNVASHREQSYQLLRGNLTLQDKQGARGEHGNNVDYEYCFQQRICYCEPSCFLSPAEPWSSLREQMRTAMKAKAPKSRHGAKWGGTYVCYLTGFPKYPRNDVDAYLGFRKGFGNNHFRYATAGYSK